MKAGPPLWFSILVIVLMLAVAVWIDHHMISKGCTGQLIGKTVIWHCPDPHPSVTP